MAPNDEAIPIPLAEPISLQEGKQVTTIDLSQTAEFIQPPTTVEIQVIRDTYRSLVSRRASDGINEVIPNGISDHASILYEQFFLNARENVRIYCKDLSNEVFGTDFVVNAASKALEKKVRIDVIIQDERPKNNKFSQLFRKGSNFSDLLSISRACDGFENSSMNFSAMDCIAYRIEPNREEIKASANMCDPVTAVEVVKLFDDLKNNSSQPLTLT